MNKEQYAKLRKELMAEAETFLNEGDLEKSEAKMEEVKELDNKFEEIKLANANFNALKDDNVGKKIENEVVDMGEKQVENIKNMSNEELLMSNTYRDGYLKRLQGKELTELENAAVSAQSVIPTQTMDKIIEKLEQTAVLYNRITVTNFPNKLSLPVETATADASWLAIATASTDSADTVGAITLGANKLIKTIEIEADIQAMSINVFESFIVNALSKKMSKAIENAIINGTGTNQPTGLVKVGEITEVGTYTKAAMTYKDLMRLIGTLPTPYHGSAAITLPRALFFGDILGMVDTAGKPVVLMDAQSPTKFNVLGYPVIINDYMPLDTIIFGDFSYYHLNWAKAIEVSSDKSVAFRSGSTVYRALALADAKKTMAEAFVKFTRATA